MDWTELDNSPALLRRFLAERELAPKKRWGQNFMIAPGARELVVKSAHIVADDAVWEIGPGLGAITSLLLAGARSVKVFEVDHGVISVLRERFGKSLTVVVGDAVRTIPEQMTNQPEAETEPDVVVGNLPYRSAAAIIAALLEGGIGDTGCRRMVFTVQREMAQRMAASPGSRDYSPFSILCSLAGTVTVVGDLAGGSFYPRPDVVSSLVAIDPREHDSARLLAAGICARSLFSSRRKTIRNNVPTLSRRVGLSAQSILNVLEELGIVPSDRAETLAPEDFVRLGDSLLKLGGKASGPNRDRR